MSITHERDPDYYFEDGSIIFLVEGVLFKIQLSRLAQASEVFDDMLKCPVGTGDKEGASDDCPVELAQIPAEQFRNLLYIFFASPISPDYISFMTGAQTDNDKRPAFKRYQNIASLSHRFGMQEYEEWAMKQIQQMICSDSSTAWMDLKSLFDTLSYAKLVTNNSGDDHFERDVRDLIFGIIHECAEDPSHNAADISTMLGIYQNRPPGFDLPVYGFIFTCILSLGRSSAEWRKLTRADRDILYAAQDYLAPLQTSTLPVEPLTKSSKIVKSINCEGQSQTVCFSMSQILQTCWDKRDSWGEEMPLAGIRILRTLPDRRRTFAQKTKDTTCFCHEQCRQKILAKLDENLNALFTELANYPQWIIENA